MGELNTNPYWQMVSKLYQEDIMVIPKATKQEAGQITNLAKDADMKLKGLEDARLNYIMKAESKYNKQLYGKLIKKYNTNPESLTWQESHLLSELKKADANELEHNEEPTDNDMEKLKETLIREVNDLTTKLRRFGVSVAPLQGDFSLEALLEKLNEMREQAKAKVRPQETEQEPEEFEPMQKSDTPICNLELSESIPGIGNRGNIMRIFKDGWQLA